MTAFLEIMIFLLHSFLLMFFIKDPATAACIVPNIPYPQLPDDSSIGAPQQVLDGYPSRNLPRGIGDQGKQLVFINKLNPEVDVSGVVPHEGLYVIIAEYYQPDHPLVTLGVNVTNGASADREGGDQQVRVEWLSSRRGILEYFLRKS